MPSVFPSLSAFGGVKGIGKSQFVEHKDKPLKDLNSGYGRMIDTFIYNYPELVRDNPTPFATVQNNGKNIKVAIIGAGFAGAVAAYELERAGIENITVYEARRKETNDKNSWF